jgi:hypothetical protein
MHGLILLPALIIGVTVASACLAQTPMPVQAQPLATGQPQVQLQAPIQLAGITPDQPPPIPHPRRTNPSSPAILKTTFRASKPPRRANRIG